MNLRIPRAGLVALIFAFAASAVLFAYLSARFGGPSVRLSAPYTVSATFDDTKGLTKRSEVLVRGVKVGEVESLELREHDAEVELAIDSKYEPLSADATVRIGQKTLFGEAYVDLDLGSGRGKPLRDGDRIPSENVLPAAADVDEALDALGPAARENLSTILREFGTALRPEGSAERVNRTLASLEQTVNEVTRLTDELAGQEREIAAGVEGAGRVVGALAEHEASLREIVGAGRRTLSALGENEESLRAGLELMPETVGRARSVLSAARPLLAEARPLAADLATAAPDLERTLAMLPPVAEDVDALLADLPELEPVALPFLKRAGTFLDLAEPVVGPLEAALRNMQPIAEYLADRKRAFASWFSNTGDLGVHRDRKGHFARFFVGFDPATMLGLPGGNYDTNPYTGPDDALHPQPYSGYPRLMPYDPKKEAP